MLNQLVRYAPLLAMLRDDRGSLLEVGSGQAGISQFLRRKVVGVEIRFPGPPGEHLVGVGGSAVALPFPDRAFATVLVMDTIEHIPRPLRLKAIDEAMRVARRTVIVGGPMGGAARDADVRLAAYYRRRGLPVPEWLAQHVEEQAPDIEDVAAPLREGGFDVDVRGNENLRAHLALMRLETRRLWYRGFAEIRTRAPGLAAAAARLLRFAPYYSYLVVARRRDSSAVSQDASISSTIGPQS